MNYTCFTVSLIISYLNKNRITLNYRIQLDQQFGDLRNCWGFRWKAGGAFGSPFHSNTPRLRLCLQPAFSASEFSNAHWEHSNLAHKVGLICLGRTQKLRRSRSIPSLEKLEVVVGQKAVRSVDFDPGFLFLSRSNRYLFPSWAPAFHSWSIQVSVKRSESGSRFAFCGVSTGFFCLQVYINELLYIIRYHQISSSIPKTSKNYFFHIYSANLSYVYIRQPVMARPLKAAVKKLEELRAAEAQKKCHTCGVGIRSLRKSTMYLNLYYCIRIYIYIYMMCRCEYIYILQYYDVWCYKYMCIYIIFIICLLYVYACINIYICN